MASRVRRRCNANAIVINQALACSPPDNCEALDASTPQRLAHTCRSYHDKTRLVLFLSDTHTARKSFITSMTGSHPPLIHPAKRCVAVALSFANHHAIAGLAAATSSLRSQSWLHQPVAHSSLRQEARKDLAALPEPTFSSYILPVAASSRPAFSRLARPPTHLQASPH